VEVPRAPLNLQPELTARHFDDVLYEAWRSRTGSTHIANHLAGSGITLAAPGVYVPPKQFSNYPSALKSYPTQTTEVIQRLVTTGKVARVTDPKEIAELVVNPLAAIPKDPQATAVRVVLDPSRWINPVLPHLPMVLPGVDDAITLMTKGAYLAKVDLSEAFLHIRVRPEDQRLLGFKWQGEFYKYTYMPWGLSTAPAHFQEATGAVAAYLRSQGLRVIVYLDDFLLIAPDFETATSQLAHLYQELEILGLTINKKKSTVVPTQQIKFLGLELDSVTGEIRVPHEKVLATLEELQQFKRTYAGRSHAHLKPLQSLVGRLSFLARAVRNGRVFLRQMWNVIKPYQPVDDQTDSLHKGHPSLAVGRLHQNRTEAQNSGRPVHRQRRRQRQRNSSVPLYSGFWADLEWWTQYLPTWNGVSIWPTTDTICCTDSSPFGFGFHAGEGDQFALGRWPHEIVQWHINVKELLTVELACCYRGPHWKGKTVLFGSDSTTVVAIINRGTSRTPRLMAIRRRIAAIAARHSFTIRAIHIPGVKNRWADELSRSLAELLSLSPSSSELMRAGPRWLQAQADLDSNIIEALRPGSPIAPLLCIAAHQLVFSGREAFEGTPYRQAYEDFVSAAREGVRDLAGLATALDERARARPTTLGPCGLLPGGASSFPTTEVWHTLGDRISNQLPVRVAQLDNSQRDDKTNARAASTSRSEERRQEAASSSLDLELERAGKGHPDAYKGHGIAHYGHLGRSTLRRTSQASVGGHQVAKAFKARRLRRHQASTLQDRHRSRRQQRLDSASQITHLSDSLATPTPPRDQAQEQARIHLPLDEEVSDCAAGQGSGRSTQPQSPTLLYTQPSPRGHYSQSGVGFLFTRDSTTRQAQEPVYNNGLHPFAIRSRTRSTAARESNGQAQIAAHAAT